MDANTREKKKPARSHVEYLQNAIDRRNGEKQVLHGLVVELLEALRPFTDRPGYGSVGQDDADRPNDADRQRATELYRRLVPRPPITPMKLSTLLNKEREPRMDANTRES